MEAGLSIWQEGHKVSADHDGVDPGEAPQVLELDLDGPFTGQFLGALKDNLQRAEDAMAKRLVILTILAFMYFLLVNNDLDTVNLGIIEVSNIRIVELAIPVVFAYIHLSVMTIGVANFALLNGIRAILRNQGAEAAIAAFVPPDGPFAYQLHMMDEADFVNHRGGFFFVVAVTLTRMLVYSALPLAFLAYCVWHAFSQELDVLAWLAISATVILAILAVPTLVVHAIADQRRFV